MTLKQRIQPLIVRYWRLVPGILLLLLLALPFLAELPPGEDFIYPLHLISARLSSPANILLRPLSIFACGYLVILPFLVRRTKFRPWRLLVFLLVILGLGIGAVQFISPALSTGYGQIDSEQTASHRYYLDAFDSLSDTDYFFLYRCDSNGFLCRPLEEFTNWSMEVRLVSDGETVRIEDRGQVLIEFTP